MKINFSMDKLVQFIRNDEEQKADLEVLAEYRGADVNTYIDNGIFYSPDINEVGYIMEQLGYTDLLEWGIGEENEKFFKEGYIIPVIDSYGELMMFINYSFERDSNYKYINILLRDEEGNQLYDGLKVYGCQTVKQAFEEGRMFIQEGIFDTLRFIEEGIPSTSIMGSKLTPYLKEFYGRFDKLYYLGDSDYVGDMAYRKYKEEFPKIERIGLPVSGIKDVDEYGKRYKKEGVFGYSEWIKELKEMGKH